MGEWRKQGRPEAALLGAQYLANDRGNRQQPYTVTGADTAPWAFAGTGLGNGSTFGLYGVEIDAARRPRRRGRRCWRGSPTSWAPAAPPR